MLKESLSSWTFTVLVNSESIKTTNMCKTFSYDFWGLWNKRKKGGGKELQEERKRKSEEEKFMTFVKIQIIVHLLQIVLTNMPVHFYLNFICFGFTDTFYVTQFFFGCICDRLNCVKSSLFQFFDIIRVDSLSLERQTKISKAILQSLKL